jgi:DNA polymerase bacteriophage-type
VTFYKLHLDFETRSELALEERGLSNYAHHPSTQVLMLAYAIDDGPVELWEAHLGEIPKALRDGLYNPFIAKTAWNASF